LLGHPVFLLEHSLDLFCYRVHHKIAADEQNAITQAGHLSPQSGQNVVGQPAKQLPPLIGWVFADHLKHVSFPVGEELEAICDADGISECVHWQPLASDFSEAATVDGIASFPHGC
jgi:hypothetical protein